MFSSLSVMLIGISCVLITKSLGWKLMLDPPLYHYIAKLIMSGLAPYRDIFDMNFPGTYALHLFVVNIFGAGDFSWRLFDLTCLLCINISIFAYCRRFSNSASLSAVALFTGFHLINGPLCAGQRDYIMLVFLFSGTFFFLKFTEKTRSSYLAAAGLLNGSAAGLKPFAGLWILFLAAIIGLLFRNSRAAQIKHLIIFLFSSSICLLCLCLWLWWSGGLIPFFEIVFHYLIPLYSGLKFNTLSSGLLVDHLGVPIIIPACVILLIESIIIVLTKNSSLKHIIIRGGIVYGILHYGMQGKGLYYHLYPLMGFLFMTAASWTDSEYKHLLSSLKRSVVAAVLAFIMCWFSLCAIKYMIKAPPHYINELAYPEALIQDLKDRVPPNETVQNLETMSGGILTLLKMDIIQPTGFICDGHLFHNIDNPYIKNLRTRFLGELQKKPPLFIVVAKNTWPIYGYERLNTFPDLRNWLQKNYTLDVERERYRLYKRKAPGEE